MPTPAVDALPLPRFRLTRRGSGGGAGFPEANRPGGGQCRPARAGGRGGADPEAGRACSEVESPDRGRDRARSSGLSDRGLCQRPLPHLADRSEGLQQRPPPARFQGRPEGEGRGRLRARAGRDRRFVGGNHPRPDNAGVQAGRLCRRDQRRRRRADRPASGAARRGRAEGAGGGTAAAAAPKQRRRRLANAAGLLGHGPRLRGWGPGLGGGGWGGGSSGWGGGGGGGWGGGGGGGFGGFSGGGGSSGGGGASGSW
ncbi:MAG: hypothetical protein E6G94_09145 [Alphaproteobacteria bacterium]|nr:MAG: hypothetical protein E6G94_09145 [Alphaproteobacteria bacterium]